MMVELEIGWRLFALIVFLALVYYTMWKDERDDD